ncbi:MAG TPA: GreA/GreB family elongation factor [Steroidobacteraceae bacterium]|nr:GreA/GreB family elongation factor [Steroidobacteraceae bacterium]
MSRAFVKESEDAGSELDLPERSVSPHRNLVTADGLEGIEAEVRRLEEELAAARGADDKPVVARCQRDLRYWTQRRATAEVVPPPTRHDKVRFGSTVTIRLDDGGERTLRIVGEDQADPAAGLVAYMAPVAAQMIGAAVGERVEIGGAEGAIVAIR